MPNLDELLVRGWTIGCTTDAITAQPNFRDGLVWQYGMRCAIKLAAFRWHTVPYFFIEDLTETFFINQAQEYEDAESDEINIVKAEAWAEGPKAVAAHYAGDASNYTTSHRHYEGNGRLRNANGIFSDWTPSEWMAGNEASKLAFSLSPNGILTIKQTGLYYVYAQVRLISQLCQNWWESSW